MTLILRIFADFLCRFAMIRRIRVISVLFWLRQEP
jgi:hypothetical protein